MNEMLSNYIQLNRNDPSEYFKIIELSKNLLISLPSSRENIFDNLQSIFKFILTEYLKNNQVEVFDSLTVLEELKNLIISFIPISAKWRNFIFIWSLKLLANISQDFSNHIKPYSLETSLNYWTSCHPVISILSILSQCTNQCSSNECISDSSKFLLYNFSIHSEWLVSHIGLAFPNEILETALNIGLKEFKNSNPNGDKNLKRTDRRISLNCIIKIVDFLAGQHFPVVKQNLTKIIKSDSDEKVKIYIPNYFIHLSIQSDILHLAISGVFIDHVDDSMINSYIVLISKNQTVFNQYTNCLPQIIDLFINSNSYTYKILGKIILSSEMDNQNIKMWRLICIQIMNKLMIELYHRSGEEPNLPFFKNIENNFEDLCEQVILNKSSQKKAWYLQLLKLAGNVSNSDLSSDIFLHLFLCCKHPCQMTPLLDYHAYISQNRSFIVDGFVTKLFKNCVNMDLTLIFNKILTLLKIEDSASNKILSASIQISLLKNLNVVCSFLFSNNLELQKLITKVLDILDFSVHLNFSELLSVGLILTDYFFLTLNSKLTDASMGLCVSSMHLIGKLSALNLPTQFAIVRALVENSILKDEKRSVSKKKITNLIEENKALSKMLSSSNIIFHSGTFSKKSKPSTTDNNDGLSTERKLIVSAIWLCASAYPSAVDTKLANFDFNKPTPEMTKLICSTLVELVSPDLMYTGPQWPVEEYIKVTIERDLHVRNQFRNKPILWDLLDLISITPGGLLQCSCVVRSLLATLMNYWEVSRDARSSDCPSHLADTHRLLEIINKAQLLPDPLCYTSSLISGVTPYEAFLLLLNIWRYMKILMNGATQKPIINMLAFTDVIHLVIQNNISQLGHLYTLFFKL